MSNPAVEAFAEYLRSNTHSGANLTARLVTNPDGRNVLKCGNGFALVRFELAGRPDGLRPQGHNSAYEHLRDRVRNSTGAVRPQDWMELDREYGLYEQRGEAALLLGVQAFHQGRTDVAMTLCRLCVQDTGHQRAILAFAAQTHPAGQLSGTPQDARLILGMRSCAAEAFECLMVGGPNVALQRLRHGLADLEAIAKSAGSSEGAAGLRRLQELAARLSENPAANATSRLVAVDG